MVFLMEEIDETVAETNSKELQRAYDDALQASSSAAPCPCHLRRSLPRKYITDGRVND